MPSGADRAGVDGLGARLEDMAGDNASVYFVFGQGRIPIDPAGVPFEIVLDQRDTVPHGLGAYRVRRIAAVLRPVKMFKNQGEAQ